MGRLSPTRRRPVAPPAVWNRDTGTDHVRDLVAAVVRNMDGPVLRYSQRVALLKQARRAGIEHFDANLIISAVQHRLGERLAREPRPPRPWMRTLGIAVILEAWIVAGIWWMIGM